MSTSRLFVFILLIFFVAAASINDQKNIGFLKHLFKSSGANKSVIKDIDYTPEKNRQNKLENEKPAEIKDSILQVNRNLELSELLRQENVYSLFRYMQRQFGPAPYLPAVLLTTITALTILCYAAIGIGVGVGVGVPASYEKQEPLGPITVARFVCQETPENNLDIPVDELTIPDSGCGTSSVRFGGNLLGNGTSIESENGFCAPLLKRGPCTSPFEWVTIDPNTLQAQCSPRLCGRDRVFVECDGLCHDINDPNECRGGRRLFYTAFGNTTCDCPIGQYPFPNRNSDCVALFTQGPCPPGQVVSISEDDSLVCSPSQCQSVDGPGDQPLQMVPFENGQCFALGTRGPCPANPFHLLGYDVFERRAVCVNMEDPSSPYFSSSEEDALIDSLYNQIHPEYDFQVILVQQNLLSRNDTAQRKQSGVFQFPSRLPVSLLPGCRPGGSDSGCVNPIVPNVLGNLRTQEIQQAVRSPFCEAGKRYSAATKQCRNIF